MAHSQKPPKSRAELAQIGADRGLCLADQVVGQIPMGRGDDPDEDHWFRPVWEHELDETRADDGPALPGLPLGPPAKSHRRSGRMRPDDIAGLLGPLCAAQDALARLDARAGAAPAAVREGLCARLAFQEAAGWLAHAHAWAHPLDLALRDLDLTGSYAIAARCGRGEATLPFTYDGRAHQPWEEQDIPAMARADQAVATALCLARLLRRLASSRDDPLDSAANASALLSGFGVDWIDGARFRQWRTEFPVSNQPGAPRPKAGEGADLPPLLAAARAAHRWMEAGLVEEPEPLPAVLAATCHLTRAGRLRAVLPLVWAAYPTLGCGDRARLPRLRIDVAARLRASGSASGGAGGGWVLAFLHLVTEGALAGLRELERLETLAEAAAGRIARCDRRSRLPDAFDAVLRVPALTPKALAGRLDLVPQTATALLRDLRTGRAGPRNYRTPELPGVRGVTSRWVWNRH